MLRFSQTIAFDDVDCWPLRYQNQSMIDNRLVSSYSPTTVRLQDKVSPLGPSGVGRPVGV